MIKLDGSYIAIKSYIPDPLYSIKA